MAAFIRNFIIWRLGVAYFVLFSVNSIATCLVAAFAGVNWDELTATAKFVLVCAVTANWTSSMLAFLNRAAHKLQEGRSPFDTDPPFKPAP